MEKGIDYIGVGCWGIVTNDQNQILLIKKKINDYWERPGGNVEVGERLEDCIVREVKEETGIEARVAGFVMFEQVFFGPDKKHWLAFCYHLEYISGEIKNMEPEKHDDIKWFSFSSLPKNLSPHTAKAINKYLNKYTGVIIEESLENTDVLKDVTILKTKIEPVTDRHKTPWVAQWSLLTFEIPNDQADIVAEKLSKSLDSQHSWYADFKNQAIHYIIFRNRIFKIDRTSKEQYNEAKQYGLSLGIPDYQVDFHPEVTK